MIDLSGATRAADLVEMAARPLDVLVVGGGITGAGVAREAALRGLRVGLVERADLASGTSSRSSKLIHGGVRYLQQGEVGLVIEAAAERRTLRQIAPHLTRPRPMLFPTRSRGMHTKLGIGLWTWEKLARIPKAERHRMLGRAETLEFEPTIEDERLVGAALYPENLTDDARLVIATVRSAKAAGALIATRATVEGLEPGSESIVRIVDGETGARLDVRAAVVVNATGPWSDALRRLEEPGLAPTLQLTKGIHFVLRRAELPIRSMVVMTAVDRRPVFAIPRADVVYVGTTDTPHPATDDYPSVDVADVEYLLQACRRSFHDFTASAASVVTAWAGLRPLLLEEGKKPSEISRKDEITVAPSGTMTVAGGKLTTFRAMAEKVVDRVVERLGRGRLASASGSTTTPLDGGDLAGTAEELETSLRARFEGRLGPPERLAKLVERLVLAHGSHAETLLEAAASEGSPWLGEAPVLGAEVDRAVRAELALGLADVLERRLRVLLFAADQGRPIAREAAERMAALVGWDPARVEREIEDYERIAAACRLGHEGRDPREDPHGG